MQQRHQKGAFGVQICAALADLFDTIVLDLYEAALGDLGEAGPDGLASCVALVAHGGYGRRDVAPYSDVDLMILHEPGEADRVGRWPSGCCATCSTRGWIWATACARPGRPASWPRRTPRSARR